MQIRKAERKKAKLRLGVAGPSGSGKTFSALKLSFGLGGKVGMIDTEHGSGDLYAHLGEYDIINIEAPYTVQKYLDAIAAFEKAGYDVIIIDSLSHAWAGDGGLLDKQGKIADTSGNSYTAWRKVTPEHNALVEAMLASSCHIIATVRSKQEYSQEKDDKGKTVVRKLGMAPVQREGMEYEFTVFLDVAIDHTASASKDRTSLFDGRYFKINEDIGEQLLAWLDTGTDAGPSRAELREMALIKATGVVTDFKSKFGECADMPQLAEEFTKAQKAVKDFKDTLHAESIVSFLNELTKAKDARKDAIQKKTRSVPPEQASAA